MPKQRVGKSSGVNVYFSLRYIVMAIWFVLCSCELYIRLYISFEFCIFDSKWEREVTYLLLRYVFFFHNIFSNAKLYKPLRENKVFLEC